MSSNADYRSNETREITCVLTAFVNHAALLFTHRKAFMGGGFITDNRRLINVLQVINRQWYIMSARSEVDVMNLSAPI